MFDNIDLVPKYGKAFYDQLASNVVDQISDDDLVAIYEIRSQNDTVFSTLLGQYHDTIIDALFDLIGAFAEQYGEDICKQYIAENGVDAFLDIVRRYQADGSEELAFYFLKENFDRTVKSVFAKIVDVINKNF